jgi:DNA-directed RNA polymerase specialized sigma24 family protein
LDGRVGNNHTSPRKVRVRREATMAMREDSGARSAATDPDVAGAAAGDQSAWDRLVERHAQRVWRTARRFGLDVAGAADVCHLTWMRVVDHLDELSADAQLPEWLSTSAEREARGVLYRERSSLPAAAQ